VQCIAKLHSNQARKRSAQHLTKQCKAKLSSNQARKRSAQHLNKQCKALQTNQAKQRSPQSLRTPQTSEDGFILNFFAWFQGARIFQDRSGLLSMRVWKHPQ